MLISLQQDGMCPHTTSVCQWYGAKPGFIVMPFVVATVGPHIDRIGYWTVVVMSLVCMSGWAGLLTDNCNTFRNIQTHRESRHTHTHTLPLLFIGILWLSTFLLRRLIVAGCVALHKGKTQELLFLQTFPEHACAKAFMHSYTGMFQIPPEVRMNKN